MSDVNIIKHAYAVIGFPFGGVPTILQQDGSFLAVNDLGVGNHQLLLDIDAQIERSESYISATLRTAAPGQVAAFQLDDFTILVNTFNTAGAVADLPFAIEVGRILII